MAKVHLTPEDLEKCQLAKSILENDYVNHYTNNALARLVLINEKKLKIGFKIVAANQTPHKFVTNLRIEKAKELLENTYLPVDAIASRIGIDQSNFIRQFKKITNKTPKEWRNESKHFRTGYAS
jgi:AraC family transcriptional regulator